jgi:hypothetical protein
MDMTGGVPWAVNSDRILAQFHVCHCRYSYDELLALDLQLEGILCLILLGYFGRAHSNMMKHTKTSTEEA